MVVIVGRPNVGKSTLFNRLTRSRKALVHDLPGVTRDRIVGEAMVPGGRMVTVVDTGGLLLDSADGYLPLIRSQAEAAIRDADVVLFLLDGAAGMLPEDREIGVFLRSSGRPVVVVANKSDTAVAEHQSAELYSLGLGDPVLVSAEHGMGLNELWEAVEPHLGEGDAPGDDEAGDEEAAEPRVAIIGRPNVGKSSLLNRLLGEARVMVSDVAGTTRDAVDVLLQHEGASIRFVDTAGIRRKGRTDRGPEVLSVVMARQAIERADVCLLLVDATEGVTRQDAHVGGYAWEAGRAVVLVMNKWDLVSDREDARRRLDGQIEHQLTFLRDAPSLYLSALTGQGVHRVLPTLAGLAEAYQSRVTTADLNRVLREAWQRQPPSIRGHREPKLYYAAQVRQGPPGFALVTNLKEKPHFSYRRYLENVLRDAFGFAGVPIRVMIRGRRN